MLLALFATSAEAVAPRIPVPAAADDEQHHDHHDHPGSVAAAGVAAVADDTCDGFERLDVLDGALLCTHGEDHAPATQGAGSGEPVPRRDVTCIGDGVSGQRVEVLYVYPSGTSSASSRVRSNIRGWVEQVEWTIHRSADRFGGDRRVRWRTDGCVVRVTSVSVTWSAMQDFGTMIDQLRQRGYDRRDRSYLLFVNAKRYCGIATAPRDDRPTQNRADRTSGYARVDRPCWDSGDEGYHSIAAHELVHTLGAVQASAPNATSGAHCTDEHDLLCYGDGSGGSVRTVCRDGRRATYGAGDWHDRVLDCRGDDYFHPDPPRGSYLDTHWNVANSARLFDPEAPTPSSDDEEPTPTGNPIGYAFGVAFD